MRRLLWFTIGFALGCGLCVTVLWQKELLPMLLYASVCAVLCLFFRFRNDLFRFPLASYLGLMLSFAWFFLFQNQYLMPISHLDGKTLPMRITVTDYSEKTEYGSRVDGFTELAGKPYRVMVYHDSKEAFAPGEVMEGEFRLRLTTPGGEKDSPYHQGSGVFLVAAAKGTMEHSPSERSDLFFWPARVAKTAGERIAAFFPEDTAGFAKALLLGDTSDLTYSQDTALKISGIRHVAAVSGLHVSILFGLVYLLLRSRRWLVFLVSLPLLLFFAAVTGFSPSVTRACLMCGLMAFGGAVREEYDSLTSLAFAVLCMLFMNPFVLLSVSFQLSVASVSGILLFTPPIAQWLKQRFQKKSGKGFALSAWFTGSVSVSLGAMVFSTPLSAFYFGTVSLIGVLTNLLTLWIVAFLFVGIGAVCVLGGGAPLICQGLGWLLAWPIRYVLFTAELLSKVPFAAVYTESGFITAWLAGCYALLLLFLVFRRGGRACFALGFLTLLLAVAASVMVPKMDSLRLEVLDVGEGQSILLRTGGKNLLIDCGGSGEEKTADKIAQTLLSQGILELDGLVLTHYDADHVNALWNLMSRIPIARFYLPQLPGSEAWISKLELPGNELALIAQEAALPLGRGTLTFLEPGTGKNDNENSMCILFESEECVILITGDRSRTGELELLERYTLPRVDILIAGHHGSKYATSQELLDAVKPEIVVISVGSNNYGHPAQETLERLEEYNCTVYRTDLQGSVLLRR